MMHEVNGHWWGMGWAWIVGVLLLILLGLIIFWVVRGNKDLHQVQNRSAMDILKDRYAKGEIGKEEYEKRKKNLI